jgi:hypothetical protein
VQPGRAQQGHGQIQDYQQNGNRLVDCTLHGCQDLREDGNFSKSVFCGRPQLGFLPLQGIPRMGKSLRR